MAPARLETIFEPEPRLIQESLHVMELFTDEQSGEKSSLIVALAWYEAVRRKDIKKALELCHTDVELGWSRGLGKGADLLSTWLSLAGDIEFRRAFQRDATIVFERTTRGREGEQCAPAILFEIEGSRLRRIIRYRALADALRDGHLTEREEVGGVIGRDAWPAVSLQDAG